MKQNHALDSSTERVNYDSSSQIDAQATSTVADLAMEIGSPNLETLATVTKTVPSSKVPESCVQDMATATLSSKDTHGAQGDSTTSSNPTQSGQKAAEFWKGFVKETSIKLHPKEKPFLLDSGELCVTIPNVVVEKNKRAWECFIIGQFYEEPPPRGAVHAIVNGIWSRQRRDITVSKMDGHAFLFRVPCPNARRRILAQSLWQIDGQTMFVAKWSPGLQQVKPELEMVPVWLEFTGVPLQFFNPDALKEIAGIVGHPICLHPSTEQLTNIEVAKVYTFIDPRKPLPEFVNARFESGDTRRISVSSPFLPSLCSYCKKVGHTISRCKAAPKTCTLCNSVRHVTVDCPRYNREKAKGKAPVKSLLPIVGTKSKMEYRPIQDKRKGAVKQAVGPSPAAEIPITSGSVQPPLVDATPAGDSMLDPPKMITGKETSSPAHSEGGTRRSPTSQRPLVIAQKTSPPARNQFTPHSKSSTAEYNDLAEGGLCVDFTPYSVSQNANGSFSSGSLSDRSSYSGDEDNPDEENDKFIEVISRRQKKLLKGMFRARGSLIL